MRLTLGILPNKLGFIYAVGFIWLDGFAVTSPSAGNANRWAEARDRGNMLKEVNHYVCDECDVYSLSKGDCPICHRKMCVETFVRAEIVWDDVEKYALSRGYTLIAEMVRYHKSAQHGLHQTAGGRRVSKSKLVVPAAGKA